MSTAKVRQEVTSGVMQVSMKSAMTTGGTDSITTLLTVLILKAHGAQSGTLRQTAGTQASISGSQCLQHHTRRHPLARRERTLIRGRKQDVLHF